MKRDSNKIYESKRPSCRGSLLLQESRQIVRKTRDTDELHKSVEGEIYVDIFQYITLAVIPNKQITSLRAKPEFCRQSGGVEPLSV